jgi:hypothetical protein
VRVQSVLALADLDVRREEVDLPCALTPFPCPWLEERPQLWPLHAKWSEWAAENPAGVAACREVVGQRFEDATPSSRSRAKGLALAPP